MITSYDPFLLLYFSHNSCSKFSLSFQSIFVSFISLYSHAPQTPSSLKLLSRVKLNFNQKIIRNNELLVDAEVIVIPINSSGKIIKLNEDLYSFLNTIS